MFARLLRSRRIYARSRSIPQLSQPSQFSSRSERKPRSCCMLRSSLRCGTNHSRNWSDLTTRGFSANAQGESGPESQPKLEWIRGAQSPFGIDVLDLRAVALTVVSTSRNPEAALTAMSYGERSVCDFEMTDEEIQEKLPCNIDLCESSASQYAYACVRPLPNGDLFLPEAMEDKWAIYLSGTRLYFVRSWTATVAMVVDTHIVHGSDCDTLQLQRVHTTQNMVDADASNTWSFGHFIDFLMRSHVLTQHFAVAPLLMGAELGGDDDEANLATLAARSFSLFGKRALIAARSDDFAGHYDPANCPVHGATPTLRSNSTLITAVEGVCRAVTGDHNTSQKPASEAQLTKLKNLAEQAFANGEIDCPGRQLGYSALHIAAVLGCAPVVHLLLEAGASVLARSDSTRTPLHELCSTSSACWSEEVANALIRAGAKDHIEVQSDDGTRPIHMAVQTGSIEAVRYLLDCGADINAKSLGGLGFTPLHNAAEQGHAEKVTLLLERGADRTLEAEIEIEGSKLKWTAEGLARVRWKALSQPGCDSPDPVMVAALADILGQLSAEDGTLSIAPIN